jgi:hypothetical protein
LISVHIRDRMRRVFGSKSRSISSRKQVVRWREDAGIAGNLGKNVRRRCGVRVAGADQVRDIGGVGAVEHEVDELVREVGALAARLVQDETVDRQHRAFLRRPEIDGEWALRFQRVLLRPVHVARVAVRDPDVADRQILDVGAVGKVAQYGLARRIRRLASSQRAGIRLSWTE